MRSMSPCGLLQVRATKPLLNSAAGFVARTLSLINHERFRSSDMKRLFQLGKTRIPFMACLCATIFCLLFALTGLAQVTTVPPFVGTNSETWERFGINSIPGG